MSYSIDIYVNWNTQDDTVSYRVVDQAADPSRIVAGG